MGTLSVKTDAGATLWTRSGNNGNTWESQTTWIGASSFYFEGVRGSSYTGAS